MPPISTDEVLEVHELLTKHTENLTSLFVAPA
jgi:hypothetical protein